MKFSSRFNKCSGITEYTAHDLIFRFLTSEILGEQYIAEAEAVASKIYTERKKELNSLFYCVSSIFVIGSGLRLRNILNASNLGG